MVQSDQSQMDFMTSLGGDPDDASPFYVFKLGDENGIDALCRLLLIWSQIVQFVRGLKSSRLHPYNFIKYSWMSANACLHQAF